MRSAEKTLEFYKQLKAVHDLESRRYTKTCLENSIDNSLKILNGCNQWINDSRKGRLPLWKDQLQEAAVSLKAQANALDKPFRLFVIGTGKAGKSSVLNALVGQYVAETDYIAKTWKIDVFHDADTLNASIKYADGTEKEYTEDEARQIVDSEEEKAEIAGRHIREELRRLRSDKELKGVARIEAEQSIKRKFGFQSQIVEAEWPVSGSNILKQFSLVDTPGTNQKLTHRNVTNSEMEYFRKANGVLWVIPADMIAEDNTHKAILALEKKYGRKSEQTIAIINKMDIERKKDPEHGVEKIMQESSKLYGNHFHNIIPFEAENAYKAVCEADEVKIKSSGLSALLQTIRDEFYLTARDNQLLDMQENICSTQEDVAIMTNQILQEIREKENEYNQKRKAWEEEIRKSCEISMSKMESIFKRTLRRIRSNAERYEEQLDEMEGEERQKFIEDYVLERNHLLNDFENFRRGLESDIQLLLQQNKKKIIFVEYPNLFASLQNQPQKYDDISVVSELGMEETLFSTFGGQTLLMGAISTGAAVLLGPLGLAAGLLAATPIGHSVVRWFQKITGNGIVDKISEAYEKKFNDEQITLKDNIRMSYSAAEKKLLDLEDETFSQVYVPVYDLPKMKECFKSFNRAFSEVKIKKIKLPKLIKGGKYV